MNAGQVWSGGQVGWTTLVFTAVGMTYVCLDITYFAENNKKKFPITVHTHKILFICLNALVKKKKKEKKKETQNMNARCGIQMFT